MKKKIMIIGGGGAGLLLVAFMIVASAGVPDKPVDYTRLRGTEEYYTSERKNFDAPSVTNNLKGAGGKQYILLEPTFVYRTGPEIAEGENPFAAKVSEVTDFLNMLLSSLTYADVEGEESKRLLKERMRSGVEGIVFPEKKGRIEQVLYRKFYVQ